MKAYRVEYDRPTTITSARVLVLASTAGDAVRKVCRKLHIGPTRIESVQELEYDCIIAKG